MKKFLTLLILISSTAIAQKESYQWRFGNNAGLDFNTNPPTVINNSAMSAFEGVSSIADFNGALLFYTDGIQVWDANNNQMPNGFGLFGNPSSTQSGLILRQPGSTHIYYLFTVDNQLGANGYCYSIIDMNLNGGMGDVTTKNTLIYTPCTEKISGCTHANGVDNWVLTHDWNNNHFQAFMLTAAGFNPVPVVSAVGPTLTGSNVNTIGYLRISPSGTRVATAISGDNQFWLFDFDRSTGVVSNAIQLNSSVGGNGAYGVDFSPNSNVLYGTVEGQPIHLYQWDLSSGNAVTINASRYELFPTLIGAFYMGSISNAPNGKMYFTRNTCGYLGSIENPNVLGIGCNMIDSAIYLNGATCVYGLYNLNTSFMSGGFNATNLCFGDTTFFNMVNSSGVFGAQWDFDDPTSGINNTSSIFSPYHIFTAPGTYSVQLIKYYLGYTDTINQTVEINVTPSFNFGNDTTFCIGTNVVLNPGGGYTEYLWQDNSTDTIFTVTQSGTYSVLINGTSCPASDTITLTAISCQTIIAFSSSDTSFCEKQCVDFTDLSNINPTSWQWLFPGGSPDTSTAQNPTGICYNTYGSFDVTLIACNGAVCDTIVLTNFINEYQNPIDSIWQSNDTLYSLPFASYQWYQVPNILIPGATNQYYVMTATGTYFCIVNDSIGCVATSNSLSPVGINENGTMNFQCLISPNPGNGTFAVSSIYAIKRITIFNALAQKVYDQKYDALNNNLHFNLNEGAGIYSATVETTKGNYLIKLVVK